MNDTAAEIVWDFQKDTKTCVMCKQQPPGARHFSVWGGGPFCDDCWSRYLIGDFLPNDPDQRPRL